MGLSDASASPPLSLAGKTSRDTRPDDPRPLLLHKKPCVRAVPFTPADRRGLSVSLPRRDSLPRTGNGSASATDVSKLLPDSLALRPAHSLPYLSVRIVPGARSRQSPVDPTG